MERILEEEENRGESKQEVWEKKSKQSHFQNGGVKTIGSKQ